MVNKNISKVVPGLGTYKGDISSLDWSFSRIYTYRLVLNDNKIIKGDRISYSEFIREKIWPLLPKQVILDESSFDVFDGCSHKNSIINCPHHNIY